MGNTKDSAVYPSTYTLALRRARRVLAKHDLPLGKITGRYAAYGSRQRVVEGWSVHRLGVSSTIAISYLRDYNNGSSDTREERQRELRTALDVLRAAGMPFDDRGWLECVR